ncbi:MAG: hypothetical protein HZA14_13150 [Nitrospirae bacterium]|nr:hypothetical protein [Nitrospirota bacterium]
MSEYTEFRVPAMSLNSLEAVKDRLEVKELTCSGAEHLTCKERVSGLGESISERFTALNGSEAIKMCSGFDGMETIVKALSLKDALLEERHQLIGALVERTILHADIEVLEASKKMLSLGDVKGLSAHMPEIEGVFQRLSASVKNAHLRIAAAEKDVIVEKAAESFAAIGYDVRTKNRGKEVLISGAKDDFSIAAKVTDDGGLHIDMAGFEGGTCKVESERLFSELSRRGIGLSVLKSQHHGKKEGGVLANEVAVEFNPLKEVKGKSRGEFLRRIKRPVRQRTR